MTIELNKENYKNKIDKKEKKINIKLKKDYKNK